MKGNHTKIYTKFMERMYPPDFKAKLKSHVKQVDEKYGVVTWWEIQVSNWMFARALCHSEARAVELIKFLAKHDAKNMKSHLEALKGMMEEIPEDLLNDFIALPIMTVEQLKKEIYATK